MAYLKRCKLLHQATPDAVLQHPDHPLYLPFGFAIVNGDVVMDNAQPFAEPCCKDLSNFDQNQLSSQNFLTNCFLLSLVLSPIPICSTTPGALQEIRIIQLPKANIINYNNFLLFSQCMSLSNACLQLYTCNNNLHRCYTN